MVENSLDSSLYIHILKFSPYDFIIKESKLGTEKKGLDIDFSKILKCFYIN